MKGEILYRVRISSVISRKIKISKLYFKVNFLQLFVLVAKDIFTYVPNSKSNDIDFLKVELIRTKLIITMLNV